MAKAQDFKFCKLLDLAMKSVSVGKVKCPSNGRGHSHVTNLL